MNVLTVTVATSVAVLLTTNVIIFILGFVCGHCCCSVKHKSAAEGRIDLQAGDNPQICIPQPQHPILYENVHLETEAVAVEEQDPEISTNVAYGHLRIHH